MPKEPCRLDIQRISSQHGEMLINISQRAQLRGTWPQWQTWPVRRGHRTRHSICTHNMHNDGGITPSPFRLSLLLLRNGADRRQVVVNLRLKCLLGVTETAANRVRETGRYIEREF